jgi:predicted secreted protein
MATAKSAKFSEFVVLLGDGASVEVFSAPCGLTSRGFNQTASTQDTTVPDCADDEAPAFVGRGVDSLSGSISGSGVLAMDSFSIWKDWFLSGLSKNIQILVDKPMADGGGHWAGAFVLTSFNITSERGQKAAAEVTMESDEAYVWVAATV